MSTTIINVLAVLMLVLCVVNVITAVHDRNAIGLFGWTSALFLQISLMLCRA